MKSYNKVLVGLKIKNRKILEKYNEVIALVLKILNYLGEIKYFMIQSLLKVGIICPGDDEYLLCKKILKLINKIELAGRAITSRRDKDIEVIAIKAGEGRICCASATQLIIDKYQPDFIFDIGASGALTKEISIDDIVCCEKSFEYNVDIGEELVRTPDDFITSTVFNKETSRKALMKFSNYVKETMGTTLKAGNIASGEKDVDNKELSQKLHEKFNAIACNWETSSVLKTAQLNGVKSLSFRVITDNADESMDNDYNKNNIKALEVMFPVLNEFIFEGWIKRFN